MAKEEYVDYLDQCWQKLFNEDLLLEAGIPCSNQFMSFKLSPAECDIVLEAGYI